MAKLLQYSMYMFQLALFCILCNTVNAQKNCRLIIYAVDADSININSLGLQQDFNDKTSCIQYVNRLPSLLGVKGYAAASVDSLWEDSTAVYINLYTGNQYVWQELSLKDSDVVLLSSLGYTASD